MGLHNLLNANENSLVFNEKIRKLIYLLVADRVLYPDKLPDQSIYETDLTGVINRNSDLIKVFPEFFKGLQTEAELDKIIVSKVNSYLDSCLTEEKSELLHIPGRVYEVMLSTGVSSDRKKQGAYYTPSYIIEYMTNISIEYLTQNYGSYPYSPKVLDPACGGASFLIEYLNKMLDSSVPVQTAINSIYGVDIDNEAVLTAIFTLTLAVKAKSQNFGSLEMIKHMWQLQIKEGNALCKCLVDLSKSSGGLSNGIDWVRSFSDVFGPNCGEPGFDIVIGNPPYISNKLISTIDKKYYRDNYLTASGQYDLSVLFMEQGVNLLKNDGVLTFITSNKFMAADYGLNLRQQLIKSCEICEIVDVSTLKSFKNTAAYPVIISTRKRFPSPQSVTRIYNITSWEELAKSKPIIAGHELFTGNSGLIITTRLNSSILPIIRRIESAGQRIPANKIRCGIASSGFNRWVRTKRQIPSDDEINYYPFIQAGHITAYSIDSDDFIDLTCFNSEKWLSVKGPKLVIPGISKKLTASVDFDDRLMGRVYFISEGDTEYDLYYLTVIFNSYLLNFYYSILYWPVHLEGGYLRFNSTYLANIPVVASSLSKPEKTLLINSLKEIGTELVSGNLTSNLCYEKQCLANALTFELYDICMAEAQTVMDFLNIPPETGEKVLSMLRTHASVNFSGHD